MFPKPKKEMSDKEYKSIWKNSGHIQIKMIEKCGKCTHKLNDTFYYDNPYQKPKNVCEALLHVLDLYTWRVITGFPSWESDNRHVYRVHCPSKKGTVWEMKRVDNQKK